MAAFLSQNTLFEKCWEFPGGQAVKDSALSLLWLRPLLWFAFDHWPWELHAMGMAQKNKQTKNPPKNKLEFLQSKQLQENFKYKVSF